MLYAILIKTLSAIKNYPYVKMNTAFSFVLKIAKFKIPIRC